MKQAFAPEKSTHPACPGWCDVCGIIYGPFVDEYNFSNHDGRDRLFTWTGRRWICSDCYQEGVR